ncbi:MAG: hypothetical protein ACTSP4_13065 [Candidatus Hodarchaeales archaeon]
MTRYLLGIEEIDRSYKHFFSATPWKGAKPHYPPDTRVTIKAMH